MTLTLRELFLVCTNGQREHTLMTAAEVLRTISPSVTREYAAARKKLNDITGEFAAQDTKVSLQYTAADGKAKETYKEALIHLAMARQAYEAGSGKAYAELLQRCEELRSKITAHEQAAADSHDLFRRAFAAANYTQTKEVKSALFNKNDAATMAEELRLALAECEANTFEPQVQASNDAQSYLLAHRAAFETYAHLQVYQALAEMGEPLARALALVRHCELPRLLTITDDPEARREAFVWACIKDM